MHYNIARWLVNTCRVTKYHIEPKYNQMDNDYVTEALFLAYFDFLITILPQTGQCEHFIEQISHTTKWEQGSNKTSLDLSLHRTQRESAPTLLGNDADSAFLSEKRNMIFIKNNKNKNIYRIINPA